MPTGLACALVKVSFSSVLAIVVGADKYLLFPAWQGNEWEGRGTHCDSRVRDTNKPAGSFLPHWRLKTQYTIGCALGQIYSELGCFCVWVSDGEDETESKGTGGRGTAKKKPTERDTGPEFKLKKGKCF